MSSKSNSLNLLSAYGSDSDRSTDSDDVASTTNRKNLRLAVPKEFLNSDIDTGNNPDLHKGRLRSFPHERGNWVTHIFIPCDVDRLYPTFLKTIVGVAENLELCDDFHISLSRAVVLRHHWIDSFISSLRSRFKNIKRFKICFDELDVYVNDENTRTFLGLKVSVGYKQLEDCLHSVDQCLNEFNLPLYYQEPSFHLSIAWCVGNRKNELVNELLNLQAQLDDIRNVDLGILDVTKLCCKTGNRIYQFDLE